MIESDYSHLAAPVHRWVDAAELIAHAGLDDAVHVVGLPDGSHVDLLFKGLGGELPILGVLPVFFSGAIARREGTTPPYFSGMDLTDKLGLPLIAVSDPVFTLDDRISLGWYAGVAGGALQTTLTQILSWLADTTWRELLTVGGAGGGFAALYYAAQLGIRASALAWNPQTDFLRSRAADVAAYLRVAGIGEGFDGKKAAREQAAAALLDRGVEHRLPARMRPRRSIVLQNASDWHVRVHLAPLVQADDYTYRGRGWYVNSAGHCVLVADFGAGRVGPSQEILQRLLEATSLTDMSARVAVGDLLDSDLLGPADDASLPRDLRAEADAIGEAARLDVEAGDTARVVGVPGDLGPMSYRFTLEGPEGRRLVGMGESPSVTFERDGASAITAAVIDGFGNVLFQRRAELA